MKTGFLTHEHEFEWEHDPIFEDGAAIFVERCQYVEILGSHTSERYDETFYNEGPRCEEEQRVRLELTHFRTLTDDWIDVSSWRELDPKYSPIADTVRELLEEIESGRYEIDGMSVYPEPNVVTVLARGYIVMYGGNEQ